MPRFNGLFWREACKYVCLYVYVCAPVHVDELEVEKIAFLQPLNHKEPTKSYTGKDMVDHSESFSR